MCYHTKVQELYGCKQSGTLWYCWGALGMKWNKHWKHSTNDNPFSVVALQTSQDQLRAQPSERGGTFLRLKKKDLGTKSGPRFLQWERTEFLKRPWLRGKSFCGGENAWRRRSWDGKQTQSEPKTETKCSSWGRKRKKKKTCAGRRVGRGRVHQRVRITGERYIQYRWQLSDGERRKCVESGSRYTRGGRRSENGEAWYCE